MICETQVFVTDGDYRAFYQFDGDPFRDLHVLDDIEVDGRQLIIFNKSELCGISHSAYAVMIHARSKESGT